MTSWPTTPRRRVAAAALALAAALPVLAACGTDTANPTGAATSATGSAATTGVTTIAGDTVRVPGSKPIALFFFSVGCGECAGGAKSLATAATAVGGKAAFLAVDMDPSETTTVITDFLHGIDSPTLPAAIDTGAVLSRAYQVSALSTLIVVDPTGKVTYRATDPAPEQIQTALTQAGAA